jgi:peptidyl-prolyl cis-trans isomerase SurA
MIPLLSTMKLGEYSRPTEFADERGRKGVRIVYLKSRTEPHRENLKDDYNKIADRALEEKKEDAIEKWFRSKINTYHIYIAEEYKSCEVMQKWQGNKED